jgi:hypothetical protein
MGERLNSDFFSLVPGFLNGVKALHYDLVGVCFVLALTGLLVHTIHAMIRRDLAVMFPTLVRLIVVALLVGSLGLWGDMLSNVVTGLITDMGVTGTPATVFQDYQAAIALKMGTAAAAQNLQQVPAGTKPGQAVPSPLPDPNAKATGLTLTDFGYEAPGSPNFDQNSHDGVGAFPFSSAKGSLIPNYSAALSPDVAQQYNIQPGQSFSVTTTGGQSYNLVYADKTADYLTGRVDIYSPSGDLGGDNFSQSVTSLNGGPVVQGQQGLANWMPNPGGSIGDQILWAITLGLSWIASGIMWFMNILQGLLYQIEVAVSPVFIAFLMIPALTYLARRFFLTLVAITLWPFGWAVANLVTLFLVNLAVNPANNAGLGALNGASVVTGPLAGLAYLLVIAIWVMGSTLGAPLLIGAMLATGGGTAVSALFGATLGAAAISAARTGSHMIGGPVGAAALVGSIGGNGSAPISAMSASRMNGATPSYAKRPVEGA